MSKILRKVISIANIQNRGENSYRFIVSLGKDADGKYKRATKTYHIKGKYTPKQLKEHLNSEYLKFKEQVLAGQYIAPQKMTFSEFSKEWENKFAVNELSVTTLGNRLRNLKLHINPVIGHMQMDKINHLTLLNLLTNLTRKDGKDIPMSALTKQDIYRTLQSVFKYAVEWHIIKKSPMAGIKKPKNKEKLNSKVNVYDEEEVTEIMDLLQSEPLHWRMLFTLAVTAGLRRGELLGLEWSRVNFENSQIEITQTIVLSSQGPVIKAPKSHSSNRIVTLTKSVIEELRIFKDEWIKNKLAIGDRWTGGDKEWVFCSSTGNHLYPSSPSNWWSKFAKKQKIRYIRFHDLRHTSASLLIAKGVHAKIISVRLGHSDTSITMNTYGHALPSADRAAADTFESLFTKGNN